jgi:hypothetical protein
MAGRLVLLVDQTRVTVVVAVLEMATATTALLAVLAWL